MGKSVINIESHGGHELAVEAAKAAVGKLKSTPLAHHVVSATVEHDDGQKDDVTAHIEAP